MTRNRHDLGQYFTPRPLADLLAAWAIRTGDERVLDPSCGAGDLLLAAGERLGAKGELHGIEIDPVAARSAKDRLGERAHIAVQDFFDDDGAPFDVIIGNPPYVRHELIPDKARARAHLGAEGRLLDARSDLYVYFITRSLQRLRKGGRLAFIVSNRWLQTSYGEKLQRWLLDHCTVDSVVSLDRNAFDDALVGTVLLFLEKRPAPPDHKVKLLRLGGKPREVSAASLRADGNWRVHLYAPDAYFALASCQGLVPLATLARPEFGIKTGVNALFYKKAAELRALGLSEALARPLLKSVGQLDATDFGRRDTELRVLDLEDLAQAALAKAGLARTGPALTAVERRSLLAALRELGQGPLATYLEAGEAQGWHATPSVLARRVWWSLGKLACAPLALTKECWREFRTPLLKDGVVCDQHLYPLRPLAALDDAQITALGAYLNSSLAWLAREVHGREASGEAMSRNELTVEEARTLPTLDVRTLAPPALRALADRLATLVDADRRGNVDHRALARGALDQTCLDLLGNPLTLAALHAAVSECLSRRLRAAHDERALAIAS